MPHDSSSVRRSYLGRSARMESLENRLLLAANNASAIYGSFIDAAYQNILGRTVDAAALNAWLQQPDLGGIRFTLAPSLTHSQEYFARLVGDDYRQVLGRAADSAGESYWIAQLTAGANDEAIEAALLASTEYAEKLAPGDAAWVDAIFTQALGRPAGEAGAAAWTAQLENGVSRFDVARRILASPEHERRQVADDFQRYLGRNADARAVDYFATKLDQDGSDEALVAGLVASSEYFRHVTGHAVSVVPAPTPADLQLGPAIQQQAARGDADLLFVGDSLTWAWQNIGQAVWNEHYAPLSALNAGVPGDRTENVLWRIGQGELQGLHPKLAVVELGTNNVDVDSPSDIAAGVAAVVSALHQQLPGTKVLVLGVLPRNVASDDPLRQVGEAANRLLSRLDDGQSTFYLDVSPSFLQSDGSLQTELYLADEKHLNGNGYQVWQAALASTIDRLMAS